jgi:hypothetical protein
MGSWCFSTSEAELEIAQLGAHNALLLLHLFLNDNFPPISEAFFKPAGVKYKDSALPPAVRAITIHARASNVRRLRLMLLLSPGSAWSNS